MNSRNTIQDELKELNSELSSGLNGTPYSVPQGYFEGLAGSVLAKLKAQNGSAEEEIAELSPLLAGLSKNMPYSIPQNYFQASMEDLSLISSEEKESLVLSFIEKEMPYQVPAGYFEALPQEILSRVSQKQAKLVSFGRTRFVQMMAAAVIVGVLVISGIFYFRNNGTQTTGSSTPDVAVELKKASTEELNTFIKNTDLSITQDKAQVTARNTASQTKNKKLFAGVSDEELKAFLDQIPAYDEELMD